MKTERKAFSWQKDFRRPKCILPADIGRLLMAALVGALIASVFFACAPKAQKKNLKCMILHPKGMEVVYYLSP